MSKEEVENRLQDFKDLLHIKEEGNYIMVRMVKWVGTENFAKISTLIKEVNGEWIPAGKQSHWRVFASRTVKGSATNLKDRLSKLYDELGSILREMQ